MLSCVCKWRGACKRLSVCHKLTDRNLLIETNWSVNRVQPTQTRLDLAQRRFQFHRGVTIVSVVISASSDMKMTFPPVWSFFSALQLWYHECLNTPTGVFLIYVHKSYCPVMLSYCILDRFNTQAPCREYWFLYFTSHLNNAHPGPTLGATQNLQLFHALLSKSNYRNFPYISSQWWGWGFQHDQECLGGGRLLECVLLCLQLETSASSWIVCPCHYCICNSWVQKQIIEQHPESIGR